MLTQQNRMRSRGRKSKRTSYIINSIQTIKRMSQGNDLELIPEWKAALDAFPNLVAND
jgi:hypothetical protein